MTVKFDQYWATIPQKNKEYKKFIIHEFIPAINRLGIHTVAGWSVLVGGYSEIIFEGVSSDLELVEKALKSPKYKELNENLLNYVKDYKTKVLVQTGRKNTYSKDIKENTVKFNQMWNIMSGKKSDYHQFVIEELYPILEELGITIAGEWEVLIGEGPQIICEGRVQDLNNLLINLQSEKFRKAKRKLRRFVEDYQSRFLSFHIQKKKGYKAASYEMI
jgi:hypothetical protein